MEHGDTLQDLILEHTVSYSFKGSTGTFTGYNMGSSGVQAMAFGLVQGQTYNRQFATSSRSNSTETAGDEMQSNAGVIMLHLLEIVIKD